jgi:hypothetical protein
MILKKGKMIPELESSDKDIRHHVLSTASGCRVGWFMGEARVQVRGCAFLLSCSGGM